MDPSDALAIIKRSSSPLDNAAESLVELGFTARDLLRINHWNP